MYSDGMNDYIERRARRRVKQKKGFYGHLSAYIAVGIFFFMMNIFTMENGEVWFMFPLMPWGAGLLIHYFSVFGLFGKNTIDWEVKEFEKEKERLRRKFKVEDHEDEYDDYLDLQEAPEMQPEPRRSGRSRWTDQDFV